MNKRFERLQKKLLEQKKDALLISDPMGIYYMTGVMLEPFERTWLLLVDKEKEPILFANRLFVFDNPGVQTLWHNDGEDSAAQVCDALAGTKELVVCGDLPAKLLLPILQRTSCHVELSSILEDLRRVKDEEELEKMRISSRINDAVIEEAFSQVREGMTEKELAAIVNKGFQTAGAEGPCFETIVAFGENASDPHHEPDDTVLQKDKAVLIDMGCYKNHYCSDMTRTRFFGSATEKEQAVYEIVLGATEKAKALIRPGVRFCDIDAAARDHIAAAGYGEYFTHRLGHCIGLQDHEPGDVGPGNAMPVEKGMVFSIEPGIYLPGEFGVRIEDLVIVTEDGFECLNASPRDFRVF